MRTAIVTGASKGIGKAIALKLAALNYALVVVGRNEQQLNEIKLEIEKKGARSLVICEDLGNEAAPEKIVRGDAGSFWTDRCVNK